MVVPEPDPVQKWADENSVQGDISSLCDEEVFVVISCLSCARCFGSKLSFIFFRPVHARMSTVAGNAWLMSEFVIGGCLLSLASVTLIDCCFPIAS